MNDNDVKRISRLTAIITQLQTKRLLTSVQLAERFNVSVRTIYRDVKALERAGIPII
jgi:predicted DNA-binding transcriptional regulator YafY